MGRVFSYEEVRDQRVPRLEAFDDVIVDLEQSLSRCEGVYGAIICGSAALPNQRTHRSDLDCLVVYEAEYITPVHQLLSRARQNAAQRFVPVQFIPLARQIAETPLHHIGGSFFKHLRAVANQRGVIKQDPLAILHPSFDERAEAAGYFRAKMRDMDKNLAIMEPGRPKWYLAIQKALENPYHVARYILNARHELADDDTKSTVVTQYRKVAPSNLAVALRHLVFLDQQYSSALASQLTQPDEAAYRIALGQAANSIPKCHKFVLENALYLCSLMR